MSLTRRLMCGGFLAGMILTAACSDDVSGPNRPPVAVAGPDQVTAPGTSVTLDGSDSYDPDGDSISGFEWSLLAVPAGSQARLDQAQARQPQVVLTPDLPGTYVLGLVVSDGLLGSARDVVQVLAEAVPCEVPADCPDDGLWCTGTPDCVGGSCVEIAPDCSDTDACTQDLCDEDLNQCTHPPVANPPPENAATAGSCTDGVDNDCDTLTDAADPGCTACTVAGDCPDDGLWCTGTPDCVGGVCVETPPDCSDIDACTQDLCDEDLNQCTHPPVANPPPEDLATAGSCTDGVDNDCDTLIDDADPGCTACQGAGDCPDDNDVCTGVECVGGACQYPPANEGGGCDDQLFCTEGDQCVLGECQGLPRDCSGVTDACNTGVCDEQAGACVPVPVQNGTSCGAGSCQGLSWTGPTCVDGGCSGSDTEDCNDGSLCTDDSCDGATGCGHTPAHEGEECGARTCDVLVWTQVVCRAGQCDLVQAVLDCDDGNVCTDDACDAATGCGNTHNTLGCDDADDCTTGDVCQGGGCAGAPLDEDGDGYGPSNLGCGLDCDDDDEFVNPGVFEGPFGDSVCSDGLDNDCDGAIDDLDSTCLQCQDDQECDNGDFCDGAETCSAGGACVAGVAPCPDTECNHCDESLNVCFDPLGTACGSSGDTACDNPDTCDGAGTCRPNFENTGFACGDPSNTDCTDPDSCDGAGTCLLNDAAASTPCGNNNDTDCDDPDSCNGAGQCLPNYVGASTPCGNPADTGCTNPDTCNGSGTCLVNHEAPGFACGSPANTECDNPDSCDGSGNCLTNYEAPGFACGSPTDTECDNPDACNGAGTCLTNYEAPGFACGSPANTECDNPDACNGSGTCLVNHEAPGFACGSPANTECDNPDSCDGSGNCLTNYEAPGFACGSPTDTECDNPDACNGSGTCLTNYEAPGFACGSPANTECDNPDACNGSGTCLVNYEAPGFACGSPANTECDNPDACNGSGTCLTNYEAPGFACGSPANTECDNPDACNGSGTCLTNYEAPGFACGSPTNTECDNPDACNGSGTCLTNYEAPGFACGSPANTECDNPDSCNGSGTCLVNYEAPGFACGSPANTECDNPDSCNGSGTCLTNYEAPGFACGSPANTECDNPDSCNGSGTCLVNYEAPGFACGSPANTECDNPDACNGSGTCLTNYEAPGFACGSPANTECDNPDACDGSGTCLTNYEAPGFACGSPANTECDNPDACNGSGTCLTNYEAPGFACGSPTSNECTDPDTCSGTGVCDPNHTNEGDLCFGSDTNQCNSTCVTGVCSTTAPAPDLAACADIGGNAGICCTSDCRLGGECCAAGDCDDLNGCTTDACNGSYLCANTCSDPNCMLLDVESPIGVGEDAAMQIDMCPGARDVTDFYCVSDRNHSGLFAYCNFTNDFCGITTSGLVTRTTLPNGNVVSQLCRNGSYLRIPLNTTGRSDIFVRFVGTNLTMDDNEMLEVSYSPDNGANWRNLALIGDVAVAIAAGGDWYQLILPPEADNNANGILEFFMQGGDRNDDCVWIDEVTVLDLLPMAAGATLLTADFGTSMLPFTEVDNEPQDVERVWDGANWRVRIDDNSGSYLTSGDLNTTAIDPYHLLVLGWDWYGYSGHEAGDYFNVEYSVNNTNWYPLSATGQVDEPTNWIRYRAVLPCEAYGVTTLRVRFIGPTSSGASEGEGVYIDNVTLVEMIPTWIDTFGSFTDMTNGIYTGTLTPSTAGSFNAICRYGCSQWSNWDPVTVDP